MKKIKEFWNSYRDITIMYRQTNARLFASSVAFFVFLAIFPSVLLVFSLVPVTPLSMNGVLDFLEKVLPEALDSLTVNIIGQLYGNSPTIISITSLLLLWSAAKGFQGIKSGLNAVNGCAELSNFIMLRLRAIIYAVIFAVLLITMVAILFLLLFQSVISVVFFLLLTMGLAVFFLVCRYLLIVFFVVPAVRFSCLLFVALEKQRFCLPQSIMHSNNESASVSPHPERMLFLNYFHAFNKSSKIPLSTPIMAMPPLSKASPSLY